MTVINNHRIFGLAERRLGTMGIAVIAVIHIRQHSLVIGLLAFGNQFVVTALCTHFRRSGKEQLELGVREHDRTDVATVHDDTFVIAHPLLLRNEIRTHLFDLRDTAGAVSCLKCTNLRLYIFAVERHVLCPICEYETDLYLRQRSDDVCGFGQSVAQGIKPDGAVHGSRIDIGITGVLRQRFRNRGLAATAVSVYGNNDLFHYFIIELISSVTPAW